MNLAVLRFPSSVTSAHQSQYLPTLSSTNSNSPWTRYFEGRFFFRFSGVCVGVPALLRRESFRLCGIAAHNLRCPERKILGLGRGKILELIAAFELARCGYAARQTHVSAVASSADAAGLFRRMLPVGERQEKFWALPLDAKRRPLSEPQLIAVGTVNGVGIHPRDVFSIAVRWNAHSIVVAHNHPSGSTLPSKRDVDLTWGLYGAGKMMGIALVDHIIITEESHYSFADNGRLCNKSAPAKLSAERISCILRSV